LAIPHQLFAAIVDEPLSLRSPVHVAVDGEVAHEHRLGEWTCDVERTAGVRAVSFFAGAHPLLLMAGLPALNERILRHGETHVSQRAGADVAPSTPRGRKVH